MSFACGGERCGGGVQRCFGYRFGCALVVLVAPAYFPGQFSREIGVTYGVLAVVVYDSVQKFHAPRLAFVSNGAVLGIDLCMMDPAASGSGQE